MVGQNDVSGGVELEDDVEGILPNPELKVNGSVGANLWSVELMGGGYKVGMSGNESVRRQGYC
jgi:hypothetical protein